MVMLRGGTMKGMKSMKGLADWGAREWAHFAYSM
jgi:hypothetical protein